MMNTGTMSAIIGIILAVSAPIVEAGEIAPSGMDGVTVIVIGGEKSAEAEGDKAWLGVYFETITRRSASKAGYPHEKGVVVSLVIPESPAERGGLKEGDIIYTIDGKVIEDEEQFGALIRGHRPGDTVVLVCYRKGREKKMDVKLGDQASRDYVLQDFGRTGEEALKSFEKAFAVCKDSPLQLYVMRGRVGVALHDLDGDLAGYFGLGKDGGALVIEIQPDSPAEEAGLKSGDVIVGVDGEAVMDVSSTIEAITTAEPGDTITVDVVRKGARKSFKIAVESSLGNAPFRIVPPREPKVESETLQNFYRLRKEEPDKLRKELEALKEKVRELEERLKEK